MNWQDDVRRAKETLDWIEARQGPLPPTNYARIETDVRTVRAMSEQQQADDARISEIRSRHEAFDFGMHHPVTGEWASRISCKHCHEPWPCVQSVLLNRLDALAAERDRAVELRAGDQHWARHFKAKADDLLARLAAAEAALAPCTLAREYRDGVTCRDERDDKGVCFNHRVVSGLRVHAVTADRLEIENRALRRQVRATYGIIHEGLHGGKPTDPEHQELCERPACRNARAALAGSTGGQEREGEGE